MKKQNKNDAENEHVQREIYEQQQRQETVMEKRKNNFALSTFSGCLVAAPQFPNIFGREQTKKNSRKNFFFEEIIKQSVLY